MPSASTVLTGASTTRLAASESAYVVARVLTTPTMRAGWPSARLAATALQAPLPWPMGT